LTQYSSFPTEARALRAATVQRAKINCEVRGNEPTVTVQRDLMRHASIVTTIDTYGDTVPNSLRAANGAIVRQVLVGRESEVH
jgi:hypothetical protein